MKPQKRGMTIKMVMLPLKEVLLVVLGGLFGWSLGKLPTTWVYVIIAATILLAIVVLLPK